MNIPDQAVEAILRRDQSWPEEYDESQQAVIRAAARRDLEAALPAIAAQVLHEHAETWGSTRDEYNRSIAFHVHLDARKYQGEA